MVNSTNILVMPLTEGSSFASPYVCQGCFQNCSISMVTIFQKIKMFFWAVVTSKYESELRNRYNQIHIKFSTSKGKTDKYSQTATKRADLVLSSISVVCFFFFFFFFFVDFFSQIKCSLKVTNNSYKLAENCKV